MNETLRALRVEDLRNEAALTDAKINAKEKAQKESDQADVENAPA